jgi:Calcineurin-like phosphoesterase
VLLAAGDIGSCDGIADDRVAELAGRLPGTIALLGDEVYETGTSANYRNCFDPAWGPMRSRIRPAVGNHDYVGDSVADYFAYFGPAAGEEGQGWYAYDVGAWHVIVLNSNCDKVGGCGPGSPQFAWLAAELNARPSECLLAYWHHPRWSSGRHGSQDQVQPFWQALVGAGVDVVLNGHDHDYERVVADGVSQIVVGTGGRSLYRFEGGPLATTAARNDSAYGLLYLALGDGTYTWEFLPLGATDFTDAGSGTCDSPGPAPAQPAALAPRVP